jgi:hypothetical protein
LPVLGTAVPVEKSVPCIGTASMVRTLQRLGVLGSSISSTRHEVVVEYRAGPWSGVANGGRMPRGLGCCYLDVAIYINDYMNTGLPQSYSGTFQRPSACQRMRHTTQGRRRACKRVRVVRPRSLLRFSPCPLPAAPYQLAQSMPILCWPPPVRRRFYIVAPRECQVRAIATTQHGKIVDQQTNKGTERVGGAAWRGKSR